MYTVTQAVPIIFISYTPVVFALTTTQSRAIGIAADYNVGM
jgi:hypothetical protein